MKKILVWVTGVHRVKGLENAMYSIRAYFYFEYFECILVTVESDKSRLCDLKGLLQQRASRKFYHTV